MAVLTPQTTVNWASFPGWVAALVSGFAPRDSTVVAMLVPLGNTEKTPYWTTENRLIEPVNRPLISSTRIFIGTDDVPPCRINTSSVEYPLPATASTTLTAVTS